MYSPKKQIAIGTDGAGVEMVKTLSTHLTELGFEVENFGIADLYPDVALAVAQAVASGKHERAILVCGTGIGVCITANKVPGIRAAVCHDSYSAQRARKSNDCQIMTLGARVVGEELAKNLVDIWLDSEFEPARSAEKVDRISEIEREIHPASC